MSTTPQSTGHPRSFRQSFFRGCRIAFLIGMICPLIIGGGYSLYHWNLPPVSLIEGLACIPLAGIELVILSSPFIAFFAWRQQRSIQTPSQPADQGEESPIH